ncbi:HTH domain-containing protein [Haladaptatus sp. DJG-WS-42]|uniref:HTH domain-containing protein n=1 Tax=Haladaptatus sp. DJG-WS-42 TaxID=3120516 RepID=UPI0030D127B3
MSNQSATRLELYVRSLAPSVARKQQDRVIAQLKSLKDAAAIDEYTIEVWGKEVCATTEAARTDAGKQVLEKITEFETWAERNGRSLSSVFEVHEIDSAITGDQYTSIVLPLMVLAEYHDDDLIGVAPCAYEGVPVTIDEYLVTLDEQTDRPLIAAGQAGQ